jgi:hypothetical protein
MLAGYAEKGDKLISVHIPSDAVMIREKLDQSYEMAKSFFNKYFPDYSDVVMYSRTWLLDPELKTLLPRDSKILSFQSDYKITKIADVDSGVIKWVYKKNYDDYTQLPENTTLQRNLKKYLLSGRKISLVTGIKENATYNHN